ncbi:MAG: tetratricopeptide repeat protein [Elusimicrobia bacterium]|nr:tetratricopeptide repeat protein [Elusimicrobiota bacterium]
MTKPTKKLEKLQRLKSLSIFIIFSILPIFQFSNCLYSQDINILYKDAMEAFYNEEYKEAIQYWEKILEIDPSQKNPEKLIEMARAKMMANIKPWTNDIDNLLKKGDYQSALIKYNQLLELDPTNPNWKSSEEKLEKFTTNVTPSITGKGTINDLLRQSVNGYLGRSTDGRIAVLASRYAWQKAKANKLAKEVFLFMDKEHPVIARLEVADKEKNVIEQKQAVVLDAIYDGKYEYALIECKLILEIEPNNILAWKRVGSIYYAQGKINEARESWQKAAKIAPNDPDLKVFLQKVRVRR